MLARTTLLTKAIRAKCIQIQLNQVASVHIGCNSSHPDANIEKFSTFLPPPPAPKANYALALQTGNLLHLSGHLPMTTDAENGMFTTGVVGNGGDHTTDEAYDIARCVGGNLIATIKEHCGGDLSKVKQVVKVFGLVNCVDGYEEQPLVVNGVSDLMIEVFGDERGKGARSAVGVNALPFGVSVEVEAIVELKERIED